MCYTSDVGLLLRVIPWTLLLGACSNELEKRPPKRTASPVMESPAGTGWKRAWIEVVITSTPRGGRGGLGNHWSVQHDLVVDIGGSERRVAIFRSADNTAADADAQYGLRVSGDGTRLAYRRNGSAEWRLAVPCAGDRILHCVHLGSGADDPFGKLPGARELVLSILDQCGQDRDEMNGAASSATSRPEDREIGLAFARAALRPDTAFDLYPQPSAIVEFLQGLARKEPEVRELSLQALRISSAEPPVLAVANAAAILQQCKEEAAQEAIAACAQALVPRTGDYHSSSQKPLCQLLALLLVQWTQRHGTASERAASTILATLRQGKASLIVEVCFLRAYLVARPELPRDPLKKLAKAPCEGCSLQWPATNEEFEKMIGAYSERMAGHHLGCFLRSAGIRAEG